MGHGVTQQNQLPTESTLLKADHAPLATEGMQVQGAGMDDGSANKDGSISGEWPLTLPRRPFCNYTPT